MSARPRAARTFAMAEAGAPRRIIFAMYESGQMHDKPFRKAARIVGDVMGNIHPHGDQSDRPTRWVRMAPGLRRATCR